MGTVMVPPAPATAIPAPASPDLLSTDPRQLKVSRTPTDRAYRLITTGAAMASLVVMGLIFLFLLVQSWPAIRQAGWHFFTEFQWRPDDSPAIYGIGSMMFGTVVISIIALLLAVPVSIGTALFINEYAPRRSRTVLVSLIDLLAAVPSLIFGLWGLKFLQPRMNGLTRFLGDHLGFIPIFKTKGIFGSSMFVCGVVLALMVIPIITSVSRAVMAEVPRVYCEAALALGGTRAGMVKEVILPFGKGGLVGASMLGLGRALGETIAIALILSFDFTVSPHILQPGGSSVAGTIAIRFGEASDNGRSALVGAGLALFVLTLLVNMLARAVVGRTKAPKGANKPQDLLVRAGK